MSYLDGSFDDGSFSDFKSSPSRLPAIMKVTVVANKWKRRWLKVASNEWRRRWLIVAAGAASRTKEEEVHITLQVF